MKGLKMDGNETEIQNISALLVRAGTVESLLRSLDFAMAYVSENELEMQYVPTFREHLVLIEEKMADVIRGIDRLEHHIRQT